MRREQPETKVQLHQLTSLLDLFGPPFARTYFFWQATLYSIFVGILLGFIALGFFNLFEESATLMWNTADYKKSIKLGQNQTKQSWGSSGEWWYIYLSCCGGLAIGCVKIMWSATRETPFPREPPSLVIEVKDLHVHDPFTSFPVMICSAISLACGASVGPEAALGAVGGAVGTLAGDWMYGSLEDKHGTSTLTSTTSKVITLRKQLYVVIGMAAAFGPLLPSPILAVMMMHELCFASNVKPTTSFMESMLLTGIASSVSFAIFVGLEDYTFLKAIHIPPAELFVQGTWTIYYLHSIWLGVVCGFTGLLGIALLGIGKKLGFIVQDLISKIFRSIWMGMLLTPAIGGALIGLIAAWMPMTLGDGNAQLTVIVLNALSPSPNLSPTFFFTLGFAKMLSLGISLGFGFIGGQIFPLVFSGGCLGTAITQITGLSPLFTLPCCMVAVPCAFTPVVFCLVSMVSVMLSLGGKATGPVFVTAIISYTTVCGMGIIQKVLAKQIKKLDTTVQSNDHSINTEGMKESFLFAEEMEGERKEEKF
jgi:H+/Cl- antiporter ClcA